MSMQVRHQSTLLSEYASKLHHKQANASSSVDKTSHDFGDLLAAGVKRVNDAQANSQTQIESLLSGGDVDTAEVITSIQKADMAFQLLVQVRNKLMKAYEEIQAINI